MGMAESGSVSRGISAAFLDWRFGGEYALLAIRRLLSEGARLQWEILGDGPDRERLLFAIHDLELRDVVSISTPRSEDETRNRLASASWFLLPALQDGEPPHLHKALSQGLPVVCSGLLTVPDGLRENPNVKLVAPRDVGALTAALGELVGRPNRE